MANGSLTEKELRQLNSRDGLYELSRKKSIDLTKVLRRIAYEEELLELQIELGKLQKCIHADGRRVLIIFEGRDAAGKGGAIMRFIGNLNPRLLRVIALPKPSETERGQWYFQRYATVLPTAGEVRFFDRSWYNRAVVEPVMGYCTTEQYDLFMSQVGPFEKMIADSGTELIKLWFSVSREEQKERFADRSKDPLKQWKLSPVDEAAQSKWDLYTKYIITMLEKTDTKFAPWTVIDGNDKYAARLESIRFVLSALDYEGKKKTNVSLKPDRKVVFSGRDGLNLIG